MICKVLKVTRNTLLSERKTFSLALLWNVPKRKAFALHNEIDVIPFKALLNQIFQKIVTKTWCSSQFDSRIFSVVTMYQSHLRNYILFCSILYLRYTNLGFTKEFIKRTIKQGLYWVVKVKVLIQKYKSIHFV